MNEGLNPCPFCGGRDVRMIRTIDTAFGRRETERIICVSCNMQTSEYPAGHVRELWNRRERK